MARRLASVHVPGFAYVRIHKLATTWAWRSAALLILLLAPRTTAATEPALASAPAGDARSAAAYQTADGRFDMDRLRDAGLEGAIDLSGFRARIDPAGRGLALAPAIARSSGAASVPEDVHWSSEFGPGGTDGYVTALFTMGGVTYVGGYFTLSGGVTANNVATWDGTSWHALGSGTNGQVEAFAWYQGRLIAGGWFSEAGGTPVNGIASWDGTSWSPLGSGVNGSISALSVVGGNLYVGGSFSFAGAAAAASIARWDGANWNALGVGVVGTVHALIEYGGALIAGGQFKEAGGQAINNVARWDGATWNPLGAGVYGGGISSRALSLTTYGGSLIAGGYFSMAGGGPAENIAAWNGSTWSGLGAGVNSWVSAVEVYAGSLVATGWFTWAGGQPSNHIASWNGSTWSSLGTGLGGTYYPVGYALGTLGGELLAGGSFTHAGGIAANTIGAWSGTSWHPLGHGANAEITALAVYNGVVVAAGAFTQVGGAAANFIASWDGTRWTPLGSGVDYPILALAVYEGRLVAGGGFGVAGGAPASCIAQWDGTTWTPLGSGLGGWVYTLTVWNGLLVAGGEFGRAGGVQADHIAAWNGTTWSTVGGGTNHYVRALTSYNGDLYAAGTFTAAGGVPAYIIARWNGTSWSALGSGLSTTIVYAYVRSLATYDGALFVGGAFTIAGGSTVSNIARWDGTSWSGLGSGIEGPGVSGYPYGEVWAMTSYNGALVVAGDFTLAGGVAANGMARWNGSGWSAFGSGIDWGGLALATKGEELFVGGYFANAGAVPAAYVSSWSEAPVGVDSPGASIVDVPRLAIRPSPFTERTTFAYVLEDPGTVRLTIYDVRGARVATLVEHTQRAGAHALEWAGVSDRGAAAPAGVYYVELETPRGIARHRVVRMR